MKANRLNLCTVVRHSLLAEGYSVVKTVNAVNAALVKLTQSGDVDSTTSDGKVTKEEYKVSVTEKAKFTGKVTMPLQFDAWHSAIAKAEKVLQFDSVSIPGSVREWLNGFAKGEAKEIAEEKALQPATK